jgi:hypothetical protein
MEQSNVAIDWVTFILSIWEVQDSNLGPGSGYPEILPDFSLSLQ